MEEDPRRAELLTTVRLMALLAKARARGWWRPAELRRALQPVETELHRLRAIATRGAASSSPAGHGSAGSVFGGGEVGGQR
jgi:hypothetical protein